MAEETKPITTQFANKDHTVEFGASDGPDKARNAENEQTIKVRALRSFHQDAHMQGEMLKPGTEFDCPRGRAAELRANGLIEYVSDGDAKTIHGEEGAKKIDERVKREQEQGKILERNLGTPLRNPELKLAEVDPKDDPKAQATAAKSSKK